MSYSPIQRLEKGLLRRPRRWLVTGVAGFIGSHLLERLLLLRQQVVGLDNFSTGLRENLNLVKRATGPHWKQFKFIEGDIENLHTCKKASRNVDIILHQAALGSVPRSIIDPLSTNSANVTGFINMLEAARVLKVPRFVYASSSSVYGDIAESPKRESKLGSPLSPYAVSKLIDELYANIYYKCYGLKTVGLRYFNVFGPRQNPNGPYAAVVPRWLESLKNGSRCLVYGDGSTTRDFCYIDNVIQANLLAACTTNEQAFGTSFNIAYGQSTSLRTLFNEMRTAVHGPSSKAKLIVKPWRKGDVRHSLADIAKAEEILGFRPTHSLKSGLSQFIPPAS